ncbi:MAG: 3-hydroxyacyl-CoA dehydrogenase family protein [Ferruginibacter sp.]
MKYVVLGDEAALEAIKVNEENILWVHIQNSAELFLHTDADAYFDLTENAGGNYNSLTKPIFINSMVNTLADKEYKEHVIRVNAWPGFLEKDLWEIAGQITVEAALVLKTISKKYITVNDEPGFVSARIVAMIINEAYSAKDAGVSTEDEIDIAMKLGTNYPYGPFEWCRKIGQRQVYGLLQKIAETDARFLPAAGLVAANKI